MTSEPAPLPRAAARTPMPLDEVDDVGDGEEVGRVAELPDDVELVLEPAQRAGSRAIPRRPNPASQRSRSRASGSPCDLELGEVHLADAEVAAGVDGAPLGLRAGAGQQAAAAVGEPGVPGDLLGDLAPSPCRS